VEALEVFLCTFLIVCRTGEKLREEETDAQEYKGHVIARIYQVFRIVTKKASKLQSRLGTVIFEAFSLRKRNSMRYTTRQQFQEKKKKNIQYSILFQ